MASCWSGWTPIALAACEPILKKFEDQYAIKVHLESPQNITDSFPTAAQSGKGPDIVIWAHDKVGEWADAGLISPIEVHHETREKYFPQAWEAVTHNGPRLGISDWHGNSHAHLQQEASGRTAAKKS